MRLTDRPVAFVALCVVLATGACGGGDSSDDRARTVDPPAASTTEAPGEVEGAGGETLTQEQLQAAALTVADVPTGYKQVPVTEDEDSPTGSDDADCAARYAALDENTDDAVATAEVSFEGPQLGTILEQSLASFEDDETITEGFDELASVFSDCPTFTSPEDDGTVTSFTISPLSFPKLGDDTLAVAITVETPDFTGSVNVAATRVGRNLQFIAQGGLTADVPALEQAARTGVEKLAAAG